MPAYAVKTPARAYDAIVERGAVGRLPEFIPAKTGKVFIVTTEDVWKLHGSQFAESRLNRTFETIFYPGGEARKRLASIEAMAEQMVEKGGDRSSLVIAFGGGIVNDLGGFLAAIFMRGIPVIQVPTTLQAQVDAAVGGKTGANLLSGKNLIGSFHQPLAVLTDPDLLTTLPPREYRAGLFEVIKHGVIRSESLFWVMKDRQPDVLAMSPDVVDLMVAESVRIKAEVVSADEKEGGLRRILNFGHTVGHALEAETEYRHFLHGEAVGIGMKAATHLARLTNHLAPQFAAEINEAVDLYGPFPPLDGIRAENLLGRLSKDKKTVQGSVHFVLPTRIGDTTVVSGLDPAVVLEAIRLALAAKA